MATVNTPASIGLGADALWDHLQARHVVVAWGEPATSSEAVLVHEMQEQAVFFMPGVLGGQGSQPIMVPAQGEDGFDTPTLLQGYYLAMPAGDYYLTEGNEDTYGFTPSGLSPSLGAVVVNVPLDLLPEDVGDGIANLPFVDDVEEPGHLFDGFMAEQMPPSLLLGPEPAIRLISGPAGGAATPLADASRSGWGRGRGAPDFLPPAPSLAPAGRGGGRGRGAGSAAAPRLSLATLSAQIASGFAAAQERSDGMELRLRALEVAPAAAPGLGPELEQRLRQLEAAPAPARVATGLFGALPPAGVAGAGRVGPRPPGLRPSPLPAPAPTAAGTYGTGPAVGAACAWGSLLPPPAKTRSPPPPPGTTAGGGVQGQTAATGAEAMAHAMAEQARAMAAMAAAQQQHQHQDGYGLLDEGALSGAPGLRGARGAAALLQWRRAFLERPEVVSARIRQNRNRAMTGLSATPDLVPSMRNYFANEVPFGHAKTAAYLVFGLADIADLLEHGRWSEAEALVLLLLSAAEQAALQEWQWSLAWLLTFSAEPPWAKIRVQAPGQTDLRAVARLADPELLAAAVGHMKDLMAIGEAQRRAMPGNPSPASGGSAVAGGAGQGQGGGFQKKPGKPKAKAKADGGAPAAGAAAE